MIGNTRRSCGNHSASLVPDLECNVDGCSTRWTQGAGREGKHHGLGDSIGPAADCHCSFDPFRDNRTGYACVQGRSSLKSL